MTLISTTLCVATAYIYLYLFRKEFKISLIFLLIIPRNLECTSGGIVFSICLQLLNCFTINLQCFESIDALSGNVLSKNVSTSNTSSSNASSPTLGAKIYLQGYLLSMRTPLVINNVLYTCVPAKYTHTGARHTHTNLINLNYTQCKRNFNMSRVCG